MNQLKMSALVLALTSIATGSAMAQSSKTNAWEGASVGISAGYGQFTPKIGSGTTDKVIAPGPTYALATASANNVNTGTANINAGYNFAINSDYVLGIGAAYYPGASSSAPGSFSFTTPGGTVLSSASVQYNVKNLYSVYLAPGYVIDKDKLVYAKVGYTGATIGLNGPSLPYSTVNLTGYTLGVGYKQMVTQSIYLLGEFNYAGFSNKTTTVTTSTGTNVTAPFGGTGMDFLVGVGYRF